jgi:hypothetical protein
MCAKKSSKGKSSKSAKPGKTIASIEVISDDDKATKPVTKAKVAKPAKPKLPKEPKTKKFSALDAAAQVLAFTTNPWTCKQLIETMAAQGLWTSPGGKTPSATLYAAIIREIKTKGAESRFIKADAGKFTSKASV